MSYNESMMSNLRSAVQNMFGSGSNYPMVYVKSNVDGKTYKVRDLPDKQKAADLLAKMRLRLTDFMAALVQKYPSKPQVQRLQQNFVPDPRRFFESTPDAEHTSYSVNKGEEIHLCLRNRGGADESVVDEDVMMFVSIHEMAHTLTKSIGHDAEFWNNFGWLLREAEANKLYTPRNFRAHPVMYCGVKITDAPKYDPSKDQEQHAGNNLQIGQLFTT